MAPFNPELLTQQHSCALIPSERRSSSRLPQPLRMPCAGDSASRMQATRAAKWLQSMSPASKAAAAAAAVVVAG